MSGLGNSLLGSINLTAGLIVAALAGSLSLSACVDPAGEFKSFDERVLDAGMPALGTGCKEGSIPDVGGEFVLSLLTQLDPVKTLKFIFKTEINLAVNPAVLSMTMQPICTFLHDDNPCTLHELVGEVFTIPDATVDENCDYTVAIDGVAVPGGGNIITGSDLIGYLEMQGNLQDTDFFCGLLDGTANVGSDVPIVGTFGALRITPGTTGADLPADLVSICPPAESP